MLEELFASIGGIQCDNKSCDYKDVSVKVQDYDQWLNKPCPKCSANLLTQSDYDKVQQILQIGKLVDLDSKEMKEAEGRISFKLDGSEDVGVTVSKREGTEHKTLIQDNLNTQQFEHILKEIQK